MNSQKDMTIDTFSGNVLLFYAFDIGDDIDCTMVKERALLTIAEAPLSGYFKHYHAPLSFRLYDDDAPHDYGLPDARCIVSKVYSFGVLSFCYRIAFHESLETLKTKIIDYEDRFKEHSRRDAQLAFDAIKPAVKSPNFFNLKNRYFAVQVNPPSDLSLSAEDFKTTYGGKIASLLKLEQQALSNFQKDRILASAIGYYGQDLIIIDNEGSFIYDDEYFEPLEFLESINVQKLELQYFDCLLDQKLDFFYQQKSYRLPWHAYIPMMHEYIDLPVSRLAKLRVDISVITERLENSIKLADDSYYSQIYHLLVERLSIKEWRDSINKKLGIIQDLYTVYQDRLDTIHDQVLSIVIIILIAMEAFAFLMVR